MFSFRAAAPYLVCLICSVFLLCCKTTKYTPAADANANSAQVKEQNIVYADADETENKIESENEQIKTDIKTDKKSVVKKTPAAAKSNTKTVANDNISVIKITAGTIITAFDGRRVRWKGKTLGELSKKINAGTHSVIAEGEFDYIPKGSRKYQKMHIYDRSENMYSDPERGIYTSNLKRTFTFLAGHYYRAQIVLNSKNEYMLYIWDEASLP